jgi:CHASE2 domain-containing sensor protein
VTDRARPGGLTALLKDLLDEHGKKAAAAAVGLLYFPIMQLIEAARSAVSVQPLPVLAAAAALAVAGLALLSRSLQAPAAGFWIGLLAYLSAFGLAASSELLVWKRELVGLSDRDLPRHWLAPARFGDWRYALAPRPEVDHRLLVVTMDTVTDPDVDRFELAQLMAAAARMGVRGIALDFVFQSPTVHDEAFCDAVRELEAVGVALVLGQDLFVVAGRQRPRPEPGTLAECLAGTPRGHLLGYMEPGGVVRHVPLRLAEPHGLESLSQAIVRALEPERETAAPPATRLLRFLEPASAPSPVEFEALRDGTAPGDVAALFRGSFLLIGERSAAETFRTPFGARLGVEIHAAAAQTLLTGRHLSPAPWWLRLLLIAVACYALTALAVTGATPRRLVLATAGFHAAALFLGSTLAVAGVWLDVVYAAAAVWGLLPVLVAQRRRAPIPTVTRAPADRVLVAAEARPPVD